MKKIFSIIAILFACASGCFQDSTIRNSNRNITRLATLNETRVQEIDSLVESLVDKKISAGASLGIKISNSSPILKTFGLADLASGEKVEVDKLFRIASITKIFTATAIVKLIEINRLSFDDKVGGFFPNFPNGDSITIYHLLSHTSGIPNWYETNMPDETPANFPMCAEPHKYIQKMDELSLFNPGESYYYSNTGYVMLGEIIEIISGKSYESFLEDVIFEPSGMVDTKLENGTNDTVNYVKGYDYNDSLKNPFIAPEIYPMPYSAGGFRSTALDLIKFFDAYYSGRIISEELRNEMTQYAKVADGTDVDEDNFYFPADFVRPAPPKYLTKYGYGLGFQLMDIYNTTAVWHAGGIAGFQTVVIHIPKNSTTLALLVNTGQGGGYGMIWEDLQRIVTEMNKE